MKKFFSIATCVFAGAVVSGFYQEAIAVPIFNEVGDAGSLRSTAAVPTVTSPVTIIHGSIGPRTSDPVDMYKIMIDDTSLFSAEVFGGAVDTVLFLFDANGFGVLRNDEGQGGGHAPELPVGSLTGKPAGVYYLAISVYTVEPESVAGLIFPTSFGSGDIDGPTGAGGGSPLIDWTVGTVSQTESYQYDIQLGGARTAVDAVPEPLTAGLGLMGLGALALVGTRRRAASK